MIQRGTVDEVTAGPGSPAVVRIPARKMTPDPASEYHLTISAALKERTLWADAGYVVATEQFPLGWTTPVFPAPSKTQPPVTVEERAHDAVIAGAAWQITFDKTTGILRSWTAGGQERIVEGPTPSFWRAPTDNDFGNGMQDRCRVWRTASAERSLASFTVEKLSLSSIRVTAVHVLGASTARSITTTTVYGNGDVVVDFRVIPLARDLPEMPRVGMSMRVPGSFQSIEWYGRGPQENYVDRKTSAFIGHYTGMVSEQFFPYVSPQESGYHTDVRWVALTDPQGSGILATGAPELCFSALPFTAGDLTQKARGSMRPVDLTPRPFVEWHIDLAQMGLGGDDSWGARPHPQYELPAKEYAYRFRLQFLATGMTAGTVARLHSIPNTRQ